MEVVELIASVIASVGVIAAAIAAFLAARAAKVSAEETKKNVLAQVIMQVMDAYSSPEMYEAMTRLGKFKEDCGTDKKDFGEEYKKLRSADAHGFEVISQFRRRCSHFFNKIYVMLMQEVTEEEFVRDVVSHDAATFLFDVVKPLEIAHASIRGKKHNEDMFKRFERIFDKCCR